ncbi:MAG: hypothetical protein K2Y02_10820, partial [Burkholderiaceae bacterium]|nr:hypothetical protein [Burkholderiaceae bacterium]
REHLDPGLVLCRIAGKLVSATNKRLEGILTRSPLRVSDVRDSVVLDGQSKGSPGQTLALGYAFLLGLFDAGQVSLPFIVDSPTGALDKNVRREIAGLLAATTSASPGPAGRPWNSGRGAAARVHRSAGSADVTGRAGAYASIQRRLHRDRDRQRPRSPSRRYR